MLVKPTLVAHRGFSAAYPENTLISYQRAYDCGVRTVELDLQLTRDHVPVLHHDVTLQRVAGVDMDVRTLSLDEFLQYPASFTDQFGQEFSENLSISLSQFLLWLADYPDVFAFIELKKESVSYFGRQLFAQQVLGCLQEVGVESQCAIISFELSVLEFVREWSTISIGWVLPNWGSVQRAQADQLQPEFLFCNKKRLPADDHLLWPGKWRWVIYDVDDAATLALFLNRPCIHYLETREVATLVKLVESS